MNRNQYNAVKAYLTQVHRGTKMLADCYKSCSHFKLRAENDIIAEMELCGGYNYTVYSHNSNFFSCGYTMQMGNNITGEITLWYVIHTPYHKWVISDDEMISYSQKHNL